MGGERFVKKDWETVKQCGRNLLLTMDYHILRIVSFVDMEQSVFPSRVKEGICR